MPRSCAAWSIATASSSLFSPHQPVDVVQRPKATSLTVTLPAGYVRYFMRGPSPSEPPTPKCMDSPEAIGDEFARVGAWIERYFEHPEAFRVMPQVQPGDVVAALPAEAPERGDPFEAIFADFERIVVPATTHWNHPRFFAYFATSAAPAAIAAE